MTNTTLLKKEIAASGLKLSFIAQKLGISRPTLWKKVNNRVAFDQYEITALCTLLHITSWRKKEALFFAKDVS